MSQLLIDQLRVIRGDRVLVPDLTFRLGAGELLHLRGANGSGKTSVLEMLAGLRRSDEGGIRSEPADLPRHWIGHRNALAPQLSALESLRFWCGLNGVDAAAAPAALAQMQLRPGTCRRPVRTLSAGQKRRAALARLLLARRPLWLLDEPLDGLDRDGIDLFAGLLAQQLHGGGMVVVTSHQPLPAGLPSVREIELGAAPAQRGQR